MDTEDNSEGMLERLRNSPRTVSAVIVILIIAGAIFAFSGRDEEPRAVANDSEENTTEVESEENDEDVTESSDEDSEEESEDEGEEEVEQEPEEVAELPEAEETADAYIEVAQPGEGATHLARRAAASFIEANPPDFEITNEHRVFIEDYIVSRADNTTLAVGEQITISKELVQEAISVSRELTDAQLQNLERFSQRVDWS